MAKNKRSFFERLTGVSHDEDESYSEIKKVSKKSDDKEDWIEEDSEEGQLTADVYQTPDDIVIKTIVAGVRPEDLDIAITRDMVTIRGSREEAREADENDYYHQELYWGTFSRTVTLPQEIDIEGAEAQEKNGLLTIRLPKLDKRRQTKLKVRSN